MTTLTLQEWLLETPGVRFAPLFAVDATSTVQTHRVGKRKRRLLRRHPDMEAAMIELVEAGLARPDWRGLVYVMAHGSADELRPLYVGMARREGRSRPVSANLERLRTDRGKFGRWGDGNAYHIGDLSQALFEFAAYKDVEPKYEAWATTLFVTRDPPRLIEPVMLALVPWFDDSVGPAGERRTVAEVERELIELATAESRGRLLNVVDVPWWKTTRRDDGGLHVYTPRAPITRVDDQAGLAAACAALRQAAQIGLDVETTRWERRLCLIQASTPTRNFLIDPLAIEDLRPFGDVLEDASVCKVIHNASFERSVFRGLGFEIANVFDTLAKSRERHGYKAEGGHSLAVVCARELKVAIDKSEQVSDWSVRPLSGEQIRYAAVDSEVLLKLHRRFVDGGNLELDFGLG